MVGTFPKYWVFITVSMSTMRKPSNMFTVFPFPFIYTPALLLAWDRIHYNANMKIKGKRKITDVSEEGRSLSNIHNFEKCLVKITVWQTWHAQETLPPCISRGMWCIVAVECGGHGADVRGPQQNGEVWWWGGDLLHWALAKADYQPQQKKKFYHQFSIVKYSYLPTDTFRKFVERHVT